MEKGPALGFFLIFAILLMILIGLFSQHQNNLDREDILVDARDIVSFSEARTQVELYIESCMKLIVDAAVDELWVIDEELIKTKFSEEFYNCVDNFDSLKQLGYKYTFLDYEVSADLSNFNADVVLDFPVEISREDQISKIDEFQYEISLNYTLNESQMASSYPDNVLIKWDEVAGYELLFRNVLYHKKEGNPNVPRPLEYFVIKVHLNDPDIAFLVTPKNQLDRVASSFLSYNGLQIAINGDGFPGKFGNPTGGFAASEGNIYSEKSDEASIFFNEDHEVSFFRKNGNVYNAVSGFHDVVTNGKITPRIEQRTQPEYSHLQPRTAIGHDTENNVFVIMVVDGRNPGISEGVDLVELAELLLEYNVQSGMNMDGGGSSTMVVEGKGVLNTPSDGQERKVANHIGIYAAPILT